MRQFYCSKNITASKIFKYMKSQSSGRKLPSVHVLGDFNFREIVWPDGLNKNKAMLSQSDGQVLIDIMNDHGLEQLIHFPTREENTLQDLTN